MHPILTFVALSTLLGTRLIVPTVVNAATEGLPRATTVTTLVVTTPSGATH